MKKINLILTGIAVVFLQASVFAYKYNGDKAGDNKSGGIDKSVSAGCLPPSTSAELNVNNVRALIHSGGDMWWDLIANARYEIPKGGGRHSLYVGTLWVGGRDLNTQTLKLAAQRYRSGGVDYWTGPLDNLGTAAIDDVTCDLYDQIWTITRAEVEQFRLCNCINPDDPSCEGYEPPASIRNWPGNPIFQADGQHLVMQNLLAPFADVNQDGVYRWQDCDYPFYDLDNNIDCKVDRSAFLYGDFTLWWVFNDNGNIHGESQGIPIGMEIRAQGFGFNTNDEINNMTFYNYELINRGTTTLAECYFGVNTDADIGGANDDYTGCDVERGFGFMYNGDAFDDNFSGQLGYGENPPAIGIDFFEGPYLDSNGIAEQFDPADILNLRDTTRFSGAFGINGLGFDDTIVDNERFGMRRFVYYNNPGTGATGDPTTAPQYYNFLRGIWKDGQRMVFGGDGYPSGQNGSTTIVSDFMFPDDSDPLHWGTKGINPGFNWREQNTGGSPNTPGDRRFVQSAGPFTLRPGFVNDITIGVVWARTTSGDPFESVLKVRQADDKAQSLFENCFRVLNGPDAPDLNVQELDRELVLFITNKTTSNNYLEEYEELNYFIPEFEQRQTAITKDTLIYTPAWTDKRTLGPGDTMWVYPSQTVNSNTADSILVLYDNASNPVDSLFGFFANPSTPVLTTINLGTQVDTIPYDRLIRFQGYLIYQLKSAQVTATDIFAPEGNSIARLVAQCDIRDFDANGNPIGRIVNFEFDEDLGYSVPKVKVNGANEGIVHSFRLTEDQFAVGDKRLVNHKKYYYMVLAYGYNNYKPYDPNDPTLLDGQKEPFFLGRRNIKVTTAIPHIPAPELGGTIINALYGDGPRITRIEGRGNGGNELELTQSTIDSILISPTNYKERLTYENGKGPIKVKVIDPLKIRGGSYVLKFIDGTPGVDRVSPRTSRWVLLQPGSPFGDTVAISEKDLSQSFEQIVYDRRDLGPDVDPFLGFSITINQTQNFGPTWTIANGALRENRENENGFIAASITFEKPTNEYLGFFPDANVSSPINWVRSGTASSPTEPQWNANFFNVNVGGLDQSVFVDPDQVFERNISFFGGGGIVPYILTSSITSYQETGTNIFLPGHGMADLSVIGGNGRVVNQTLRDLVGSIDIVLTPDKSKWTRSPVIETQDNNTLSYKDPLYNGPASNVPNKFNLRYSPSVDKNGNPADISQGASTDPESPNFVNPWGMGWFPGYAINVETGERLNIAFGEDSYLVGENGRDMLFNPSEANPNITNEGFVSNFGDFLFSGKHYIYVFGSNQAEGLYSSFPRYDFGTRIVKLLSDTNSVTGLPLSNVPAARARNVWRNVMWAGIPFHVKGTNWLDGEVRIRLRVYKNYQADYAPNTVAAAPQNNNNPMYEFNFDDLAVQTGDNSTARSALDLIQVVPNPYYANSEYENNQVDNRVKIVNLPDECAISIYSLNGTLIRRFEKGTSDLTSLEWDLKNFKNIPIASGLYIIHIKAPGIGERVIKWFGVMRPVDLDSF